MIEIASLTMSFGGVKALNDLSVTLDDSINGVIGPNGAGKTTLLNILSGFIVPTVGDISVFEQNLLRMSAHQRARWGIRRTFQTEQVVDDLTLWDNVAVMLDTVRLDGNTRRQQVQAAIDYVGLTDSEQRMGHDLNAFERRLTEIARTIVGEPRIVLMDEPGGGLGQNESEQLQKIIVNIPEQIGAMVVLIDHDVELIAQTCPSTAVLDFGSLITYGPTDQVLKDERVKAAYLGVEA